MQSGRTAELREALPRAGFRLVDVRVARAAEDPELALLRELTRGLEFHELGAGSWAAFNDELWEFLKSDDSTPYAIVIEGLDELVEVDIYSFIRCVHNLLSLTESIGLADAVANRQIEYFFLGEWRPGPQRMHS